MSTADLILNHFERGYRILRHRVPGDTPPLLNIRLYTTSFALYIALVVDFLLIDGNKLIGIAMLTVLEAKLIFY